MLIPIRAASKHFLPNLRIKPENLYFQGCLRYKSVVNMKDYCK